MKKRIGHPVFVLATLLAAVLLLAVGMIVRGRITPGIQEKQDKVGEVTATPVKVVMVERRLISPRAEFHGFIAPFTELSIAAQVPGEIVEQLVEVSDPVRADQVLFKTDEAISKIEHERALATQERVVSELELAEANWRRIEALPEQNSVSMERIEAQKKYAAAKADKHRTEAAVRQAALLLERAQVKSPIDGVVSRIHLRRGEYAQPGQTLVEIIEMDRLKLLAEIEDRDVVWVTVGLPAVMTTKVFPGERFEGRVHRIYPQALPTSRKFEIEIDLPNPGHRLRPGFFMTGTISKEVSAPADDDLPPVLIVPREAVLELYGQHFCHIVRPPSGTLKVGDILMAKREMVVVWPILSDPRSFQLVSGGAEGDFVVTKGLQHLSEQSTVRISE